MTAPELSVVVPTHDRPELLARLLDALEKQTIGPSRFETLIVDDCSSQSLGDVTERALDVAVFRLNRSGGPAAARNVGWRAARGELVAFVDDDCRPSERWLEELIEAAAGDDARIVQGRTEPEPEQVASIRPRSRTMEVLGASGLFETCNIAYPRGLLERTGGFDERFRRACGEDVDLGVRATREGASLVFAPDALVYHVVHQPRLAATLRHTRIWSDAVLTLKLHPELRSMLVAGLFWKRTHPLLLLAGLGGLASVCLRRKLPALVMGAPYLHHYQRVYARSGRSLAEAGRHLPAHVLIDAVEVATMIEGSYHHRTPML